MVIALLGCSDHAKNNGPEKTNEPIAECDSFVAAYQHCLGALGPERIAEARAEQTRAGLAAELKNAHGEAARAALRKQCVDNLSQLKATCR